MNRRNFLATGSALAVRKQLPPAPGRKALMKLGMQEHTTDNYLHLLSSAGVTHVCGSLPSKKLDAQWSTESLSKERERIEGFGIQLAMLPLPLGSVEIGKAEFPAIMLGKSPDRDRAIDDICEMIRNSARAGIFSLKYNMSILGIVRTEPVKGRGSSSAASFVYDQLKQDEPLTEAGRVTAEMSWERIGYFVKRVIPVAEEYKVRMGVHPHDPGMPRGKGYRGVERVLGSVDGLKHFIQLADSPYHGLNFCQGTVSEMLNDPAKEIFDVIRYFGTRNKIFNVHFRNIRGHFLNFQETFPDEGDVDMLAAMRVYREVGYDGMMMPDHVPTVPGDPGNYDGGIAAFSYALGYIRALIQRVQLEA